MPQERDAFRETPSQTAGPYVHIGCLPSFAGLSGMFQTELGTSAVADGAKGTPITVTGSVFDGTGTALRDAMIETWQADADGRYPGSHGADPAVSGFCRCAADGETGMFSFQTIKPGRIKLRDGRFQAPHIALWIVARGINTGLATRLYFSDEDNSADLLLSKIEQKTRVATLIAKATAPGEYRFDIRLQGDQETVFLDQ